MCLNHISKYTFINCKSVITFCSAVFPHDNLLKLMQMQVSEEEKKGGETFCQPRIEPGISLQTVQELNNHEGHIIPGCICSQYKPKKNLYITLTYFSLISAVFLYQDRRSAEIQESHQESKYCLHAPVITLLYGRLGWGIQIRFINIKPFKHLVFICNFPLHTCQTLFINHIYPYAD